MTSDEIDAEVMEAIRNGSVFLRDICRATELRSRVVDRALQRIRRRGVIEFDKLHSPSHGWKVKAGGTGPGRGA